MVAVGPNPRIRKAVHDTGFLVIVGGVIVASLAFDVANPWRALLGASLVAVGAAMVWLGSRRPPRPVPATAPSPE